MRRIVKSLPRSATFAWRKSLLLVALILTGRWLPSLAMPAIQSAGAIDAPRITADASVGHDTLSRNGNFVTVETSFNLQISFDHTLAPEITLQAEARARAVYGCIDDNGVVSNTLTVDHPVRAVRQFRSSDNRLSGVLVLRPPVATGLSCPQGVPLTLLSAEFSDVQLESSAGASTELEGSFASAAGSCVCIPNRCCCGPIGKPCKWCPGSKPCAFSVAEPAAAANADLQPVSPPGSVLFCRAVSGKLSAVIRVENTGSGFAPASITRVSFFSLGSVDLPTPGIAAGDFVDLGPVSLPGGCFNPDCDFSITVDALNSVDEGQTGESNNTAPGGCIG